MGQASYIGSVNIKIYVMIQITEQSYYQYICTNKIIIHYTYVAL